MATNKTKISAPIKAPLKIAVRVTASSKKTFLNLNREIYDSELIKLVLEALINGLPIVVYPYFTQHFQSMGSLQKAKLIDYDFEKNTWDWGEKLKK